MASDQKYGPSITVARLYERVSKNGNHYLVGRMGMAKIAILKSADTTDDGVPIWNIVLQEAPRNDHRADESDHAEQRETSLRTASGHQPESRPRRQPSERRSFDDPERRERQHLEMNDQIPF